MVSHDIFLVFVEGAQGNQEAYATWFAGAHMDDMRRLPSVISANAFSIEALDAEDLPAQLCAIYETHDGLGILKIIADARESDALPTSDIQGRTIWRVLDGHLARKFIAPQHTSHELICMFSRPADAVEDDRLWHWLGDNSQGITAARQLKLSSAQPARGREYGSFLLVSLTAANDAVKLASAIRDMRADAGARFLLARPIG